MKALFLKDFSIIKSQKKFYLVLLLIALIQGVIGKNFLFTLVFMCTGISMVATGTISYDEADNGNSFLFTMPFSRKNYVLEKYYFAFLMSIAALTVGIIFCILGGIGSSPELVTEQIKAGIMMVVPAIIVILGVSIPVKLKYGAEKSKLVFFIFAGVIILAGFAGEKAVQFLNNSLPGLLNGFSFLNQISLIFISVSAAVIFIAVSVKISISIVNKKEF